MSKLSHPNEGQIFLQPLLGRNQKKNISMLTSYQKNICTTETISCGLLSSMNLAVAKLYSFMHLIINLFIYLFIYLFI